MTNPKQYKVEAIILGSRPLGEKDRLVSIFTKSHGRFTVVAKSASSAKSKLRGCIEATSCSALELYRGKSLDLITEAQLIQGYWGLRESLESMCMAGYFLKIISQVTVEHQENEPIFELLQNCLAALDVQAPLGDIKEKFQTQLLILEGLWDQESAVSDQEFKSRLHAYRC